MKTTTLYLLLLLLLFPISAQWQQINTGDSDGYFHVSFANDSTGIIASNQVLLITQNNGITWDTVYFNTDDYISDVQFINDSTFFFNGYAFSTSGTFLKKTFDLGNNWSSIDSVTTGLMFFTSPDTGHHFQGNLIDRTYDGGLTWTLTDIVMPTVSGNIYFVDPSTGYIAGWYNGIIYKTTDYGTSWSPLAVTGQYLDIFFPSASIGYTSGWYGSISKTTDAGNTWTDLNTGLSVGIELNSIYCPDNYTCYSVGDSGTIIKTTDGGLTWAHQTSGTTECLSSVWCTDINTCYAVGDSGVVLKTVTGGVGINENTEFNTNVMNVFPNPFSNSIFIETGLAETLTLQVYNILGEAIFTGKYNGPKTEIDLETNPSGVYFVILKTEKGISIKKIFKQ